MTGRTIYCVLALLLSCSLYAADGTSYYISTVAGTPGVAGFHDGSAAEATLNRPTWLDVVTDSQSSRVHTGDVYVVDRVNQAIRVLSGGKVSSYVVYDGLYSPAGQPIPINFGGPLGGGILIEPQDGGCGGAVYDRGMFVVLTGLNRIPLVSFDGVLANRDGQFVLSAEFQTPTGVTRSRTYATSNVYDRRLYVADTGSHTIRRVLWSWSAEGCPQPAKYETFAGGAGIAGFADGAGAAARFNSPRGLATAPDGRILVADSANHVIRRIDVDGTVTTIAGEPGVPGSNDGPALQAHLNQPSGIDVNTSGEIFISDTGNHTIRKLTTDGMLATIAGAPGVAGYADGLYGESRLSGPVGIRVTPDGSILVADTSNNVIRSLVLVPVSSHRHVVRP